MTGVERRKRCRQYTYLMGYLGLLLNVPGKSADGAGQLGKGATKDSSEYEMFRDLMNMFNEERSKMETKYRETTALLRKALEDLIYLSGQNEELQRQLQHAESWEPSIW